MNNNLITEMNHTAEMTGTSAGARKKQKIIIVAVLVICMAIFTTGTMAYFTAEETAYNVITTGFLSMELIEETTDGEPWPDEGISGVMPGTEVDKIPSVSNIGGVDFYTRLSISMRVTNPDGEELSDEYISMDINREYWTEKDGYFYFFKALTPGERTMPLFTKVAFDPSMPNEYMNARVEIDIHADAVQSKNNTDSPLTASGWADAE